MAKRLMSAIFGITYVVLVLVFNGNLPVDVYKRQEE